MTVHIQNCFCTTKKWRMHSSIIGKNTIKKVPKIVAKFNGDPHPEKYTGHCFRRTAVTLLLESGASSIQVKHFGKWRSESIAQGYIEDTMLNRELLYNGVTHMANNKKQLQSTSTNSSSSYNLNLASNTSFHTQSRLSTYSRIALKQKPCTVTNGALLEDTSTPSTFTVQADNHKSVPKAAIVSN